MIIMNIKPYEAVIKKEDRVKLNNHKSAILWFTGLSGSGKSTLASMLEVKLYDLGIRTYLLDGDNIRAGLNRDLDFSREGREENIRRIAEVAKLFVDAGLLVMTAFISPYRKDRLLARKLVKKEEFIEIYVKCPLKICEERDVKGHYKKARQGLLKDFTGIDAPYEEPDLPEITIETDKMTSEESINTIITYLASKNLIIEKGMEHEYK